MRIGYWSLEIWFLILFLDVLNNENEIRIMILDNFNEHIVRNLILFFLFIFHPDFLLHWYLLTCIYSRTDESIIIAAVLLLTAADILLWKDKRKTLIALLVLVVIYYNFIAPECTMITALSKILLVALIFLFIHGSLPDKMYVCLLSESCC